MTEQENTTKVLNKLNIFNPVLLGKGGEGWIYKYGNDVLKIYRQNATNQYLENVQVFQTTLASKKFSFETPQIYQIGEVNGILYTVEKRLSGIPMDKKIIGMPTIDRQRLYQNYYRAIQEVNAVSFPTLPYGQIIKTSESITADSWADFLIRKLDQKVAKTRESMQKTVFDFDNKVELFKSLIERYLVSTQKQLVHSDYFLNNVLVGNDLAITAVLDFSIHVAVGDPRLDIAGVLTWNEIDPNTTPEDYLFLYDMAKKDYGDDIQRYADLYLSFSSFYFADMDDPSFSVKNLNDNQLWERVK